MNSLIKKTYNLKNIIDNIDTIISIIKDYQNGLGLKDIVVKYDICYTDARTILLDNQIKLREPGRPKGE